SGARTYGRSDSGVRRVSVLPDIERVANADEPLHRDEYARSILEATDTLRSLGGETGGIATINTDGKPTVVVSDIHSRPDFILNLLHYERQGRSVFELLKSREINIVFVGDFSHSELMGDWLIRKNGAVYVRDYEELLPEMTGSLAVLKMFCDLKTRFPNCVHGVRGNHDDVLGRILGAEYGKGGVHQSEIARYWLEKRFGAEFITQIAGFEDNLPLLVDAGDFVITHAAPGQVLTRKAIENRTCTAELTWTENRPAKAGSGGLTEQELLQNIIGTLSNLGKKTGSGIRWVAGHRPTEGEIPYRRQANDMFMQVNSPIDQIVMILPTQRRFNPTKDVVDVKQT
ncbi:MAG: metallophosphoesterase, partial [Candidatus Dojkabacteria bacterium]